MALGEREPDLSRSLRYRAAREIVSATTIAWYRPVITGRERLPEEGPVIIAPVHRSFSDFTVVGLLTRRKIFFMAKDELWKMPSFGRLLDFLGAFPVDRDGADREAMRRAELLLDLGQVLVLFPEGTHSEGPVIGPLFEGAAFLAARSGAPLVPVGIAGTDRAMPKGHHIPLPVKVDVVVGEPISPLARKESGRVSRTAIRATTEVLREGLQAAYDDARAARGL